MKNNLICGILVTCSLFLSCKSDKKTNDGHDHTGHDHHKIIMLPYLENKDFFDKQPPNKIWKTYCNASFDTTNYVAFKIGNSMRKLFQNMIDSVIYIQLGVDNLNNNILNLKAIGQPGNFKGKIGVSYKYGSHGCNYFLTVEDGSHQLSNPGQTKNNNKCRLDSFMIGDKVYIHLLDVPHICEKAPDTISIFENYEFPISKQNYILLDSLIRTNKQVMAGYENDAKDPLKLVINSLKSDVSIEKSKFRPFLKPNRYFEVINN
jgi:hypothetical protein